MPGLSETIRVRSIVGRFLEHSRIYAFGAGGRDGSDDVWMGSADLMHRNLDRRVELLIRVTDPAHKAELRSLIDLAMDPGVSSWWLGPDGIWTRHHLDESGKPLIDLQEHLIRFRQNRPADADVKAAQEPAAGESAGAAWLTARGYGVIRAAGGVVWRPGQAGPDIALVHRPRYDDWSYPKGKCQRGEHVLAAAIREVTEETGLRVVLGRRLTSSVYQTAAGVKRVSLLGGALRRVGGLRPEPRGGRGAVAARGAGPGAAVLRAGRGAARRVQRRPGPDRAAGAAAPCRGRQQAGLDRGPGRRGGGGPGSGRGPERRGGGGHGTAQRGPTGRRRPTWPGRSMPAARPTRMSWPACWPATGSAR